MATKKKKAQQPPKKRKPTKRKTKKAKATRRQLPTLVALLTSDSALIQPGSGKATLIGIFDRFTVAETDKPVGPFYFYQKLVGGKGKFSLVLEIRNPKGHVVLASKPSEIKCAPRASQMTKSECRKNDEARIEARHMACATARVLTS